MKVAFGIVLAGSVGLLAAVAPWAGTASPAPERIERGRYLVQHVALCVQCHSPRDERGGLLEQQLLHGAAMPLKSPWSGRPWALQAPHLAGLPGYTRRQLVELLTEGSARDRTPPMPPMPPYRMTREDAEAVADYLASLP